MIKIYGHVHWRARFPVFHFCALQRWGDESTEDVADITCWLCRLALHLPDHG